MGLINNDDAKIRQRRVALGYCQQEPLQSQRRTVLCPHHLDLPSVMTVRRVDFVLSTQSLCLAPTTSPPNGAPSSSARRVAT